MPSKILEPSSVLIETVALQLAATWYSVGRSQGLTSKYKNERTYAKANLEKFVPKAIEHLITMLGSNIVSVDQKELIYAALMERHNDSELCSVLPNVDVNKLIQLMDIKEKQKVIEINTKQEPKTVLHK